jgi:hypothetical protein
MIEMGESTVPLTVRIPDPVVEAKLATIPVKEIVGSPVLPLALVIESPVPTAIETFVSVLVLVFACIPTPVETKDNKAPVVFTDKEPRAPPSDKDKPLPTAKERLLGKFAVLLTER